MSTPASPSLTPFKPLILLQIHEPFFVIGYIVKDNIHYKSILLSPLNVTPMKYVFRAEHSRLDNLSGAGLLHGKC